MSKAQLAGDRNQCPTCAEYFNSSSSFDFHRTGRFGVDRRCRTVSEMFAVGMAQNSGGYWIERPRLTPTAQRRGDISTPEVSEYHPGEKRVPGAHACEVPA